ncbi:MAG: TIGR03668 family PPOX class F420-dependent oxidoreductase [Candidatus Bathyarchaeia archaeon]
MHRTPHVEKPWARKLLKRSRIVHLATATKGGTPYVVPICFAYDNEIIYTPIDEKPKRTDPGGLRRILNIEENPKVSLIADYYSEDWDKLHYVIVHGFAEVIRVGEEHARAISLLRCKYRQYLKMRLETRPIIKIKPSKVIAWSANGSAQQGMREL